MSQTHFEGQRLAVCDDCERTTRMKPERNDQAGDTTECYNCGAEVSL